MTGEGKCFGVGIPTAIPEDKFCCLYSEAKTVTFYQFSRFFQSNFIPISTEFIEYIFSRNVYQNGCWWKSWVGNNLRQISKNMFTSKSNAIHLIPFFCFWFWSEDLFFWLARLPGIFRVKMGSKISRNIIILCFSISLLPNSSISTTVHLWKNSPVISLLSYLLGWLANWLVFLLIDFLQLESLRFC